MPRIRPVEHALRGRQRSGPPGEPGRRHLHGVADTDHHHGLVQRVDQRWTADSYNVYGIIRPANMICPDWDTAAGKTAFGTPLGNVGDPSPTTDTDVDLSFTHSGLTPNTFYCYAVTTLDDGDESNTSRQGQQQTAATNETVRPTSNDAELTTNGGFVDRLDGGDVIKLCFSEPMRAPDVGDAIQVNDGTDIGTITNGSGGDVRPRRGGNA